MGLKFYRSSNKARKFRKRFMNTRTFFSTHKWVSCKYNFPREITANSEDYVQFMNNLYLTII